MLLYKNVLQGKEPWKSMMFEEKTCQIVQVLLKSSRGVFSAIYLLDIINLRKECALNRWTVHIWGYGRSRN